jgi:hypothetical protein
MDINQRIAVELGVWLAVGWVKPRRREGRRELARPNNNDHHG